MKVTAEQNERILKMEFSSVQPLYVNKVEKKGGSIEELNQLIEWLTGFEHDKIKQLIQVKVTCTIL